MIVRTWNLGGNYSYEEPAESYRPCLSQSGRIKNDHWHHDWTVTGGYDPGKDGDDPRGGRRKISCVKCGQTGRIAVPVNSPLIVFGCTRPGDPGKWEEGDYLIHVSGRLDRFIKFLPKKTPRLIAVPWKEPA